MSTRITERRRQSGRKLSAAPVSPAQEALQVTWLLKGHLKNAQIAYIRVGVLLARVRDEKFYAALHHPDMESYAEQRLHLGRASLYRYLQVHDWIAAYHKEWLLPKPTGFIPDLADVADLIWIEKELAKPNLDPARRAALEELRQKALDGRLRRHDLDPFRRRPHNGDAGLRAFLSSLRLLRRRGAQLAAMPPEVLANLDAAIEVLTNANTLRAAGLELRETRSRADRRGNFTS